MILKIVSGNINSDHTFSGLLCTLIWLRLIGNARPLSLMTSKIAPLLHVPFDCENVDFNTYFLVVTSNLVVL